MSISQRAKSVLKKDNPYEWIQVERYQKYAIMSGRSKHSGGRWTAWAKEGVMTERQPLAESGEVFIEFGRNRQESIDRLIANDLSAS